MDTLINTSSNLSTDSNEEIDLQELFGTLVEKKWLIAIITSIIFMASVFYVLIATPVYRADTVLQVEDKSNNMLNLSDLTNFSASSPTSTEIEIIKSRNIIGQTVDQLKLDILVKPDYFPIIGAAIARRNNDKNITKDNSRTGYAWGGERIQIEQFTLSRSLQEDGITLIAQDNQTYKLIDTEGGVLLIGKVGELAQANGVTIFISELVARIGTEFSLSKDNRAEIVDDLKKIIKVTEKGKKTGILNISLEGKDRVLISRIIENIANLYLRQNIERTSVEAERSLVFLQKQTPLIKDEMEAAEVELNNYKGYKNSVNLTLETQSLLNRIIMIETQLAELEVKHSDLSKKYTDIHPIMITLTNQEVKLQEQLEKINAKAHGLPKTQQEILRLSRDVEVATTIYTQLLNKTQELKVVKAGTVGNVRIIDTALTAQRPIKPKKLLIVLISTLLGLFLVIAWVLVRRAMNKGVEDSDLIERDIGIPVYANVALSAKQKLLNKDIITNKIKHAILCEHDPQDSAIEGLRSLRTNLHFALLEAKNNIVMVTGPSPDIGKSFVSINFAHTIAQAGQKVLLIDADMRKGHIHKEYNLSRSPGLSELITNQVDKKVAVHNSEFKNIDILTTGALPPNPSELLMHKNFGRYLTEFSKDYDLILIDTPPILAVTDATVIAQLCGITFVLLHYGMHSMSEIRATINRLRQNNIETKGFIFNGIKAHGGYGKYAHYHYEYKTQE
ncbi:Tyrosine-protein kinase Wzc [hydrothermal vent metagenome]|uniref:Tyrosine-protein kinase Wzc n=1 Tax=hydrothermal vent metagenome TaxID=652676 RepID=A0A1W1E4Z5_9ZZZZ